jgi:hypothetical protein
MREQELLVKSGDAGGIKPMRGHGLLQAIARVNRVFQDKPGGLNARTEPLWCDLDDGLKAFVFGHEYAHLFHSHFDFLPKSTRSIGGHRVAESIASWDQEYEADRTGIDLSIIYMRQQFRQHGG